MCDCKEFVNSMLEPHKHRLAGAVGFGDGSLTGYPILIQTQKLPGIYTRVKKPPLVFATFCPFCGTKIVPEDMS